MTSGSFGPGAEQPPGVSVVAERESTAGDARHRWVALIYLAMSLLLLVWVPILASTLPDRVVSHNYRLAWVGFDVLLLLCMTRTAWLAWRRSPFVVNVASATAALLVVDAWFDVTTAPRHALLEACVLALVVELPLAVLSLILAGRAQVQIATTGTLPRRLRRERRGSSAAPRQEPRTPQRTRPARSRWS